MITTSEPLGILTGAGSIPLEIATCVRARGRRVHLVGLGGNADAGIADFPHSLVPWGAIGGLLRAFRDNGCREIVIAGGVRRPDLRTISPDLGLLWALPAIVRLFEGGDDSVLRRVVRFFEQNDFRVVGIPDVAPELLVGAGVLGRATVTADDEATIQNGFAVIAALSKLDIGQAVVMAGEVPIAIEGAEGTDRMLERVRAEDRRAILVKRAKPGQELRVDLPAIGRATIDRATRAGLVGLGVEAGRVVVADRGSMVAAADAAGLFVAGAVAETVAMRAPSANVHSVLAKRLGRQAAGRQSRRDIETGRAVMACLAPWAASAAVVVVRGYVIAVGAANEPAGEVTARAGGRKPWGFSRRAGVAVLAGPPDVALIRAVAAARLAGAAFLCPPSEGIEELVHAATQSGVFVVHP
jgi:DUF1009 family protein